MSLCRCRSLVTSLNFAFLHLFLFQWQIVPLYYLPLCRINIQYILRLTYYMQKSSTHFPHLCFFPKCFLVYFIIYVEQPNKSIFLAWNYDKYIRITVNCACCNYIIFCCYFSAIIACENALHKEANVNITYDFSANICSIWYWLLVMYTRREKMLEFAT